MMENDKLMIKAIENKIKKIWSEELNVDVDVQDNYFLLGGNSLMAITIIGRIQKIFDDKINVPFHFIFSYPTVMKLSKAIYSLLKDKDYEGQENILNLLRRDIKLDIIPNNDKKIIQNNKCLLTGATGYLGAYLLRELLEETEMEIYCLVRAASPKEAINKLQNVLKKCNCFIYDEKRVHVVLGDLGIKKMGIKEKEYDELAEKIDCIYHNGAKVHFLYGYNELKNVNVDGTKEIIKFASYKRRKALFYISTISIFSRFRSDNKLVMENEDISDPGILPIGYTQSKWVAEGLIWKAKEMGIPVIVYRLGHIVGDSITGICNTGDFIFRIIETCLLLQFYPDIEGEIAPIAVDDVAKIVVKVSQKTKEYGTAYHVINPQSISFQKAIEIAKRMGGNLWPVNINEWIKRVKSCEANLPITPFIDFFDKKYWNQNKKLEFSTENLSRALKKIQFAIHPMDPELINKYYTYIKKQQHIKGLYESGTIE